MSKPEKTLKTIAINNSDVTLRLSGKTAIKLRIYANTQESISLTATAEKLIEKALKPYEEEIKQLATLHNV